MLALTTLSSLLEILPGFTDCVLPNLCSAKLGMLPGSDNGTHLVFMLSRWSMNLGTMHAIK